MNANAKKLQKALETKEVFSLVNSYLKARAFYEVTRELVDGVHSVILSELNICDEKGNLITKSENLYRCDDDTLCQKFYALADEKLKALGIKPLDMERDYCPALVAESDLREIEHEIIKLSAAPMNISPATIITHGRESRQKWLDLVIGGIVNMPSFVAESV